ncbi:hypothetical protein HDU76_004707, partial [Blyttiomyces sp. JEL0837]
TIGVNQQILFEGISGGNEALVRMLLASCISEASKSHETSGQSTESQPPLPFMVDAKCLTIAAARGNEAILRLLLQYCPENLSEADERQLEDASGEPLYADALIMSAEKGFLSCVRMLIARHAQHPDVIRRAVLFGRYDVVKELLTERDGRAFPLVESTELWRSVLELASRQGQDDILKLILSRRATVEGTTTDDESEPVIRVFSDMPTSPLHLAVLNGHATTVRVLLQAGSRPTRVAYATAISTNRPDVLELLLAYSEPDSRPDQIISFAVDARNIECLRLLLGTGCEPSPSDILFAARLGSGSIKEDDDDNLLHPLLPLRMHGFIGTPSAPHTPVQDGELEVNTSNEQTERVEETLTLPNALVPEIAAKRSVSFEIVTMLISTSSMPAAVNALNMAIHEGDISAAILLLKVGVIPSDSSFTGAVFLGNPDILSALIDLGIEKQPALLSSYIADAELGPTEHNVQNNSIEQGISVAISRRKIPNVALTCAIDAGNVVIVSLLLKKGSMVPESSDIYLAAKKGSVELVKILLRHAPASVGRAPFDLAVRQGDIKIVKVLAEAGIKPGLITMSYILERGEVGFLYDVLSCLGEEGNSLLNPLEFRELMGAERESGVIKSDGTSDETSCPLASSLRSTVSESSGESIILGRAICAGNLALVHLLLESNTISVTPADIFLAAKRGLQDIVKLFVGRDPRLGSAPLDLAVREGMVDAMRVLVASGVTPTRYALAMCVDSGREELLMALAPPPGMRGRDEVPQVVLTLAVDCGRVGMVRILLNEFAMEVSATMILMATRRGKPDVLECLLNSYHGEILDEFLDEAIFYGQITAWEILLHHKLGAISL